MSDILDAMAQWATELTWDDLGADVQARAAQALSDTVSTMVGGTVTEAADIALDHAATSPGTSPLVGRGESSTPSSAAFGNGVAASALDFDDGHYLAGAIHPGSVIVPAVLALAGPQTRVQDALVAQVVGYEIGLRAAALLWPRHEGDHYHATGCAGALGAAAAGAKLLGLDADGIARAVTIAWAHAPMSTFGTPMVKESIGWGCSTGVAAAELARSGFMRRPESYVVPVNDVLPATPFHTREAADHPFVTSIGERYESLHTYFKSFAACRYTHAAAAGLGELITQHDIDPGDITSITVGTHRSALFLDEETPRTIESAQYSFPVVLASIALWGGASEREMAPDRLDAPDRLAFATRVHLEHDPELDDLSPARYPSRVEVVTADGTSVAGIFHDAPGDPGTSFGADELTTKWRQLLGGSLGATEVEGVLDGLSTPTATLHTVLAPVWEKR